MYDTLGLLGKLLVGTGQGYAARQDADAAKAEKQKQYDAAMQLKRDAATQKAEDDARQDIANRGRLFESMVQGNPNAEQVGPVYNSLFPKNELGLGHLFAPTVNRNAAPGQPVSPDAPMVNRDNPMTPPSPNAAIGANPFYRGFGADGRAKTKIEDTKDARILRARLTAGELLSKGNPEAALSAISGVPELSDMAAGIQAKLNAGKSINLPGGISIPTTAYSRPGDLTGASNAISGGFGKFMGATPVLNANPGLVGPAAAAMAPSAMQTGADGQPVAPVINLPKKDVATIAGIEARTNSLGNTDYEKKVNFLGLLSPDMQRPASKALGMPMPGMKDANGRVIPLYMPNAKDAATMDAMRSSSEFRDMSAKYIPMNFQQRGDHQTVMEGIAQQNADTSKNRALSGGSNGVTDKVYADTVRNRDQAAAEAKLYSDQRVADMAGWKSRHKTDNKPYIEDPKLLESMNKANAKADAYNKQIESYNKLRSASPVTSTYAPRANPTTPAESLVGMRNPTNGSWCAVGIQYAASKVGYPVPKTDSAGDMERQLPSKGWKPIDPSQAGPNDIVVSPGSGGANNPSGRHIAWSVGGGKVMEARTKDTPMGYGDMPTGGGVKVYRYSGGGNRQAQKQPGYTMRQPKGNVTAIISKYQ